MKSVLVNKINRFDQERKVLSFITEAAGTQDGYGYFPKYPGVTVHWDFTQVPSFLVTDTPKPGKRFTSSNAHKWNSLLEVWNDLEL